MIFALYILIQHIRAHRIARAALQRQQSNAWDRAHWAARRRSNAV